MPTVKVSFANKVGLTLAARLDLPPSGQPLAHAVFAHCFTCTKHSKAAAHVSRTLAASGIAVLRFDFTGLGESEGQFSETTFSSNIDDLVAAAHFLARHHQAPGLLIGHSLGGAAVIRAAARLDQVRAVATIGAPADPGHLGRRIEAASQGSSDKVQLRVAGRLVAVKPRFVEDLESSDDQRAISALGKALLVLHSPLDQVVDIEEAARIFQKARHPKSFVSLDRADHLLSDSADAAYAGRVIAAWSSKYIDIPSR